MTRFDSRRRVSTYTSVWMPTGDETSQPVGGYVGGGQTSSAHLSSIDKLTFSTEAVSTLSATLTTTRTMVQSFANSGVAGYVAGGYSSSALSGVDKITFPADTKSTLSATLNSGNGRYGGAPFANSGTAGYLAGGANVSDTRLASIEKLTFSSDTIATLSATTTTAVDRSPAGFANSGVAGYVAGGYDPSNLSRIDKLTFSTDSRSTLGATITNGRRNTTGFANSGTAGYVGLGNDDASPQTITSVNKLAFSTDTCSTITDTLSVRGSGAGFAHSGTAGFFAGGSHPDTGTPSAEIKKLTFSTDGISTLSATLSVAKFSIAGAGFADSGVL